MPLSSAQRRRQAIGQRVVSPTPYAPDVQSRVLQSEGKVIARLEPEVYRAFERTIPGIGSQPATELEAAWLSGVEFVLRKLRTEIVIGE